MCFLLRKAQIAGAGATILIPPRRGWSCMVMKDEGATDADRPEKLGVSLLACDR